MTYVLERGAGVGGQRAVLVTEGGDRLDLDGARWHREADAVERALLAGVEDPVLDVGCGPGRIVAALTETGRRALGIDSCPGAVRLARRRAPVLCRSVFDRLPDESGWATILLLDGNVGIGGDPPALLRRAAELLGHAGEVVVEVEPPGTATEVLRVRLELAAGPGPWFPWALVGADGFAALALGAGLRPAGLESAAGRWFARAAAP